MTELRGIDGGRASTDWTDASFPARMAELYRRMAYVQKTGTNTHFKYRFMQESELKRRFNEGLRELHLLLTKLTVTPLGECTGKAATVHVELHIGDGLAIAAGKDFGAVVLQGIGGGVDSSDKAPMKAEVSAFKYALANGLSIQTGDDPEADEQTDARAHAELLELIRTAPDVAALRTLKADVHAWRKNGEAFGELQDAFVKRGKTLTKEGA